MIVRIPDCVRYLLIIVLHFCLLGTNPAHGAGVLIDHQCVDLSVLSDTDIARASSLRLLMRHASVGQGIDWGLDGLAGLHPTNPACTGFAPGRYDRANWVLELRGGNWSQKVDDLVEQMISRADDFDVFMMKFCYIDALGDNHPDWDYFRSRMEQLEADFPGKRFVWWTIPLTRDGQPGTDTFNELVRSYCLSHDKILFDIADIECHDPDGTKLTNAQGNEVISQNYTKEIHAGHLNVEARILVASALWRLMAAIAEDPNISDTSDGAFIIFTPTVLYVDADAIGANDGSSWQNAYTFLQDALADAKLAEKPVEIRVAQGIYKPDQGSTQTPGDSRVSFRLINDVTIRGGYAGFVEPDPNARNWDLYKSILSGDLNGDDIVVDDPCDMLLIQFNRWDNARVVVRARDTVETAVLDGFIVTGGCFRDLTTGPPVGGAGMLIDQADPTIVNCTFTGNVAGRIGGGLLNRGGSRPTLTNCTFTGNYAKSGGGIYNTPSMNKYGFTSEGSHPILLNCTFENNCATQRGGGIYNVRGNPTLTDCTFSRNRVVGPYSMSTRGSNTGVGGGMYSSNSSPVLTDCVFSENSAGGGGGICNGNDSSIALKNCTFIGNSASQAGAGLLNPEDSTLTLTNCRFISNTVTGFGGGVANYSSDATLVDCVFSGNSAHDGQIPYVSEIIPGSGGGMSAGGTPTLIRCTFRSNYATNGAGISMNDGELAECIFTGNSAVEDGGAIHTADSSSEPTITNCTFSGNSANRGGGIFFTWGAKMTMANCTFAGNSASSGNALASDPNLPSLPGYFQLTNCILWDGEDTIFDPDPYALRSAITYSNIQGGWPGQGNTDTDPLFADPGYWADADDPNIVVEPNYPDAIWVDGDYHLKSQAGRWDPASENWIQDDVTSPCIDAGDPNSPIGHEQFPNGGIINMGAYGGTAEASMSLSTVDDVARFAIMKLNRPEDNSP